MESKNAQLQEKNLIGNPSLEEWASMAIEEINPVSARQVLRIYGNENIHCLLSEKVKKEEFGLPFLRLCAITDFYSLDEETQKWFKEKGLVIMDKEIRIDPGLIGKDVRTLSNEFGLFALGNYQFEGKKLREIAETLDP
jgi:hypothetical protein